MKVISKIFENNEFGHCKFDSEELDRIVKEYMEKDANSRLLEHGMPEETIIDLTKVCGKVDDIKWGDNCAYIEADIIDTPCGELVQRALEEKKVKIRPFGTAVMDENFTIEKFDLSGFYIDI